MKKILVLNFSILAILITIGCRQNIKENQDLKNKFTVGLNKTNDYQIIPDSTNLVNTNTLLDNNKDEETKRIELENEFKMKISEHSYIGKYLVLRQNNNDDVLDNLQDISDLVKDIHEQKNDVLLQKLIDGMLHYNITSNSFIDYGSNPNSTTTTTNDVKILRDFFSQMQKEHKTKLIEILLWDNAIDLIFEAAKEFKKDHLVKNKNHKPSGNNIINPEPLILYDFYLNHRFIIDYIDDAYRMVAEKFNNGDDILECADILITESKKIYKFFEDSFNGN